MHSKNLILCRGDIENWKQIEWMQKEIKSEQSSRLVEFGNSTLAVKPWACCHADVRLCPRLVVLSGLPAAAVLAPGVRGAWEQGSESLRRRGRGRRDGDEAAGKPPAVQLGPSSTLNALPLHSRSAGTSAPHGTPLFGQYRLGLRN